MNQGTNINNVIKSMIKSSLDSYNKILPTTQINIEELMRKTEEINTKLNPKKKKDFVKGQISINEKSIELDNKKLTEHNYIDVEVFRMIDNKYIPRIRINQLNEKEPDRSSRDKDSTLPIPYYKGIMSNLLFKEFTTKKNHMKIDNKDNNTFRISKEEGSDPTVKQDYNFNPLFFSNQYIQYAYHHEGEKLLDENDLLRNAFEKNMHKNILSSLNLDKKNSLFMQAYEDILDTKKQIENIEKEDLKLCYQGDHTDAGSENDTEDNANDNAKYEMDKELMERNRQYVSMNQDALSDMFQTYFNDQVHQYKNKKNPFSLQEQVSMLNHNPNHNRNLQLLNKVNQYTYMNILFDICIDSGLITYPITNGKPSETKTFNLNGPYLTINDINEDTEEEYTISFDLRTHEKEIDNLIANPSPHRLNGQIMINDNGAHRSISSLSLFKQISSYYNILKTNLSNSKRYNALKYLSDSSITHIDLMTIELLNVLQWHNNLVSFTISYDLIRDLLVLMKGKWQLPDTLETITIIKKELNDDSNYDDDIFQLFSHKSSIGIRNIHLIDIDYGDVIHSALLEHIELFYYTEGNKRKDYTMPIVNLSIKRSDKGQSQSKSNKGYINLNMVYSLFIVMLYHMIECNNLFPISFNKLDLSNQICFNVNGLVKIITKFKMIKEIDITNTRVTEREYLIDTITFLPMIRITNQGHTIIKLNEREYEDVFRNEFNMLRESNYNPIKDDNEDIGYDLSFGIYPILERISFENTSHPQETIQQLYYLLKRLKFFQGFPIPITPNAKDKKIEDDIIPNIIKEDTPSFCENIFEYEKEYYNTNIH